MKTLSSSDEGPGKEQTQVSIFEMSAWVTSWCPGLLTSFLREKIPRTRLVDGAITNDVYTVNSR